MTLAAQMIADVSTVFMNTDDFASTVIRYIGGSESNTRAITAIVTLSPVQENDDRGRGYMHRATMDLSEDVILSAADGIKYDGSRYEIEGIGAAEHGMRSVSLIRYQAEAKGAKPLRNGDL